MLSQHFLLNHLNFVSTFNDTSFSFSLCFCRSDILSVHFIFFICFCVILIIKEQQSFSDVLISFDVIILMN